jgi:ABC-type antimicrobial peptide transport system permease subunit
MAYAVAQRTHEIGIRLALGAQRADVFKLIVRSGIGLSLLGIAIGVAGGLGLTRVIASQLHGVKAADPFTFARASLLLLIVALLACWWPARRASRVNPMQALRTE